MKTIQGMALLGLAALSPAVFADEAADTTLVSVGRVAPDFTCRTIAGEQFSLSQERGKVVLINFFATWCGPCVQELPHLDQEIYRKYKDRKDFKLIVIGREHQAEELARFARAKGISLPMAPDPKREIYGKYAEKYIPRNFVVGKDGQVKLASTGYKKSRFQELVQTVQKELDASTRPGATSSGPLDKARVLAIARAAVTTNDTWIDRAEFEAPKWQPDGSWKVLVWRRPATPGGHRVITIDAEGRVTDYWRGL